VAVDADLRAEGAENVLVAGAALPGAVPWREGSGEGIALASGYRAAAVVLEAEAVATAQPAAEPVIQERP
jgi:anaerobic glycerol-3-phosphate dehydrogenase